MREASTWLSSSQTFRGTRQTTEIQAHPRAFYATKTSLDYVHPKVEQPDEVYPGEEEEEWLELEPYKEATSWVGLESVGQESRFGQPSQPEDEFEP